MEREQNIRYMNNNKMDEQFESHWISKEVPGNMLLWNGKQTSGRSMQMYLREVGWCDRR